MSADLPGVLERCSAFTRGQQRLMIANEMNGATRFTDIDDTANLHRCYERVLRLVDLTVQVNGARSPRRELLRWRDLIAELYLAQTPEPALHRAAFRALLLLSPATYSQMRFVLAAPWIHARRAYRFSFGCIGLPRRSAACMGSPLPRPGADRILPLVCRPCQRDRHLQQRGRPRHHEGDHVVQGRPVADASATLATRPRLLLACRKKQRCSYRR